MSNIRHPAKYSDCILPILSALLEGRGRILDPFGGTGKLRQIRPDAVTNELEWPWALMAGPGGIQGDALRLPFAPATFDAVCTSPTYGNRMADHFTDHQTEKKYTRNTYRHALGRTLDPRNTGQLQWGEQYRQLHRAAWLEVLRVLKPGGVFILNISDHIRNRKQVHVSTWHWETAVSLGFRGATSYEIPTPRNRYGQNGNARVESEQVFVFEKAQR